MKWLFEKLGIIGSVCLGVVLAGGIVLLLFSSIPAAIATGITYVVIGGSAVAFSTGLMYFSYQYGVNQERQANAEASESMQRLRTEQEMIHAGQMIANGKMHETDVEISRNVSSTDFLAMQAIVKSQGEAIAALEKKLDARFDAQARREIHDERDKMNRRRTQNSDSDSSDDETKSLLKGRNNFFQDSSLNTGAANEEIGVSLRRRNNANS